MDKIAYTNKQHIETAYMTTPTIQFTMDIERDGGVGAPLGDFFLSFRNGIDP